MVCTLDKLCTFDIKAKFRKQLDFPCASDWADYTDGWRDVRKRRMAPRKEKPPKSTPKAGRPRCSGAAKPRRPLYLKEVESRSAGPAPRHLKKLNLDLLTPVPKREPVKCRVVNFTGSCDLRTHSVPNVNDQWSDEEDVLTTRSGQTIASTINLDSGHKQNVFHKEQLLLQLHQRSASLLKYLFGLRDNTRTQELRPDNISLPIRQSSSISSSELPKRKHVIVSPKDPFRCGEDYVGALIPNASRPLGYGLLSTTMSQSKTIKLSHKTLELPDFGSSSKFLLPPVNPSSPLRANLCDKEEDPSYMDSVSQLVGMLCIEPSNHSLPQHAIQKWLDT